MAQDILTQERLKELLHYSIISGKFYWQEKGPGRNSDLSAGGRCGKYMQICINHKSYYGHRLAYLYVMGNFPDCIDHINHDGLDNRWANLRRVSHSANLKNSTLSIKNKTGVPGIIYFNAKKTWVASIKVNKKPVHLYQGKDFFEACCRRLAANIKYDYHPNHGEAK